MRRDLVALRSVFCDPEPVECHSEDGNEIRQAADSMEGAELLGKSLHLVRYLKKRNKVS